MSSADAAAGLIDRARSEFGEALVGEHAAAGPNGAAGEYGLWVRVHRDAWGEMAAWLRFEEGFGFFGFLSAIDLDALRRSDGTWTAPWTTCSTRPTPSRARRTRPAL